MTKCAVNCEENQACKELLERNDEDWQKRMLLLVMIMIIAILGIG